MMVDIDGSPIGGSQFEDILRSSRSEDVAG